PVIIGADDAATVKELPESDPREENHTHEVNGDVQFADVDTDTLSHAITITPDPGNETGYGTLTATITFAGIVTWNYAVSDSDINHLAEGQTLVQRYEISIADGQGGVVTQTVTITLEGTNDAPVITSTQEQHKGTVTEDAVENTVSGKLAYQDADNDQHDSQSWALVADGNLVDRIDGT